MDAGSAWSLPRPRLPEWLRKPRTHFESVHDLKAELRRLQSAHGVRIRALPQHARVLPSRRGDVHDPRQSVHARLRILFGAEKPASRRARSGGAGERRPHGGGDEAALRGDHQRESRRSRDGGSAHFARDGSSRSARAARGARRSADAGFLRRSRCRRARAGRRAARVQSQHGDRRASLQDGASAGELPAIAGRAAVREAIPAGSADEIGR